MRLTLKRTLIWVFGTLAAIYLAILGYLFWTQDSKIFLPNYGGRELVRSPADVGLEFKNVELTDEIFADVFNNMNLQKCSIGSECRKSKTLIKTAPLGS